MESEHAAEPWEDTDFYADMSQMVVGEHILSIPDYNRARVCVNAMQGIADPADAMAKVRELLANISDGTPPGDVVEYDGEDRIKWMRHAARETLALIGGAK